MLCFVLESHAAMEGASCSYNDPGRGLNTFRRHCPGSGHRILLGAARSTAYSHTWEQGTDLRHRQRPHRRESRAKVAQPSPQQPSKHGFLLHRQIVSPQFVANMAISTKDDEIVKRYCYWHLPYVCSTRSPGMNTSIWSLTAFCVYCCSGNAAHQQVLWHPTS